MNLCFITREAPPNLMGGIGTYVANMTEVLAADGHEVTLITQWHPSAPERGLTRAHLTQTGVRVYYLPFVRDNWSIDPEIACSEVFGLSQLDIASVFAWVVADALELLIPRHSFEYIEAPEYEAPLSIFLQRRASRPKDDVMHRIPCVVHLHSPSHLIFENNDEDVGCPWMQHRKRFELESIAMADAVLAPSQYLAKQVASELARPLEDFKVMPYPLGEPLPRPVPNEKRGAGFHVLFVGRIEPRKGVFEWVEAACEVLAEYPDCFFHFVGGPHVRETRDQGGQTTTEILQALIPKNRQRHFIFHPHMPREELGRHYYEADCCVVPSRWDNYPNTCMEAMRCGKLVLASNQGGMAEMIEDGVSGLLANVSYKDRLALKTELKTQLIKAIQTTTANRAAIGKAAQKRIELICNNAFILNAHDEWRTELLARQNKKTEVFKLNDSVAGSLHVMILLEKDSERSAVNETLKRVADQTSKQVVPVLIEDPKDLFGRLLDNESEHDYWCFLTPGMYLKPTFAENCIRFLENRPEAGYCLPWIFSHEANRVTSRSGLDAGELLLNPKEGDLFCVFKQHALKSALATPPIGYYLSDILRDLMLRIHDLGMPGRILPKILGETSCPVDVCCVSGFCLHHPEDSHFQLLLAHQTKLDLRLLFHHYTKEVKLGSDRGSPLAATKPAKHTSQKISHPSLWPKIFNQFFKK